MLSTLSSVVVGLSRGRQSYDHEVICSKLSTLGGTVPLRALYLVCHKEILYIVYQCVQHILKNTL